MRLFLPCHLSQKSTTNCKTLYEIFPLHGFPTLRQWKTGETKSSSVFWWTLKEFSLSGQSLITAMVNSVHRWPTRCHLSTGKHNKRTDFSVIVNERELFWWPFIDCFTECAHNYISATGKYGNDSPWQWHFVSVSVGLDGFYGFYGFPSSSTKKRISFSSQVQCALWWWPTKSGHGRFANCCRPKVIPVSRQ